MKSAKRLIIYFGLIVLPASLSAQINPLKSQYFTNAFLINPAKAGVGETGVASAGFATQWNRLPGSPQIYSLTAEAPVTERMGIGASILNDKSGLISRTVAMGTYSYKIPFSDMESVRFGLALGYLSDNLMINDAVTLNSSTDAGLVNYNDQHNDLLKAGFGFTYQSEHLAIQSSWFNINRNTDNQLKSADRSGITSIISYSFGDKEQLVTTPLVAYRQIHGFTDYFDAGVNLSYLSSVDLSLLYHTNKSFTGGIGFDYNHMLKIAMLYNTEPPAIRGITGGSFEFSLYMPFSIRKKVK